MVQIGSLVTIEATDYTMKRYPELVGKVAIVEAAPQGPGGNFALKTLEEQHIKLPFNSFKLNSNDTNEDASVEEANVLMPSQDNASAPIHSATAALKFGTKVQIIGTDNVLQRCPHLVNQIGIIREAPVHPATWFKVEFGDGKIVTFRPSALQPVDENGQPLANYSVKPSVSRYGSRTVEPLVTKHTVRNAHKSDETSSPTKSTPTHSQRSNAVLLSASDPDTWVGRKVYISSGRNAGQSGIVRSSGNGWVQVDTVFGEVAKRAYELEIFDASQGDEDTSSDEMSGRKRSRDTSGESRRPTTASLRHSAFLNARRDYVKQYVTKTRASMNSRPDLRHWCNLINASIYSNRQLEKQASRVFQDTACEYCLLEKLPGGQFCWNEGCSKSPIYYKLTGQPKPIYPGTANSLFENIPCEIRENKMTSFLLNSPQELVDPYDYALSYPEDNDSSDSEAYGGMVVKKCRHDSMSVATDMEESPLVSKKGSFEDLPRLPSLIL